MGLNFAPLTSLITYVFIEVEVCLLIHKLEGRDHEASLVAIVGKVSDFKHRHVWIVWVGTPRDKARLGVGTAASHWPLLQGGPEDLPFINQHQCIFGRQGVSEAVVDQDDRLWFWSHQIQFQIHWFAKKQLQRCVITGEVTGVCMIC